MSKMSILLGVIASVLVLCQWFVFQSIRRYLFGKCSRIRRSVAYPVLIGFGLVTVLAVRLEFGSEFFPPGTFGRQLASILAFSYLGWTLVLSLLLIVIRAMDAAIKFKAAAVQAAGFTILRNRWTSLKVGHAAIHIGGIEDPTASWPRRNQFPDFCTLMNTAPGGPGLRILLSHRPAVFPLAARHKIDLVLAGHLHGGQIVIPVPGVEKGLSTADLISEYTQGWYKKDTGRMYLSRGTGLTFLPWRIHCPPEICVIRLVPAEKGVNSGSFRKV